jgi:hypothetical protein
MIRSTPRARQCRAACRRIILPYCSLRFVFLGAPPALYFGVPPSSRALVAGGASASESDSPNFAWADTAPRRYSSHRRH